MRSINIYCGFYHIHAFHLLLHLAFLVSVVFLIFAWLLLFCRSIHVTGVARSSRGSKFRRFSLRQTDFVNDSSKSFFFPCWVKTSSPQNRAQQGYTKVLKQNSFKFSLYNGECANSFEIISLCQCKLCSYDDAACCCYCKKVFVGSEGHQLRSCRGPGCSQCKGHHHWIDAEHEDVIPPVECYHVYDRLGPPIRHVQWFEVPWIPAVVELCIQVGVDIPEYPALRRSSSMVVQECTTELAFESQATEMKEANTGAPTCIDGNGAEYYNLEDNGLVDGSSLMGQESCDAKDDTLEIAESETHLESTSMGDLFKCSGNLVEDEDSVNTSPLDEPKETSCDKIDEVKATAIRTIKAWHAMRMGVKKLMKRYPVRACGYCPEVQVGPRGHKAQLCGAFKHQWRNGQHGWQEATLDEVVPPKFVWHVRDGAPLVNELRKYYGQAPAVVELCMKAGAEVPGLWKPFMRLHVAIPAGCLIAHLDAT